MNSGKKLCSTNLNVHAPKRPWQNITKILISYHHFSQFIEAINWGSVSSGRCLLYPVLNFCNLLYPEIQPFFGAKTVFGYRILPSSKITYIFWHLLILYTPIPPCPRTQQTHNALSTHFQHTVMRLKCVVPLLYVHIVLQSPCLFVRLILIICRVNQN